MASPSISDRYIRIKEKWVLYVPIFRSSANGLFVSGRNRCRWPIPSFFLLLISSSFTFCAASVDPPTPSLNPTHPGRGQLQIALVVSVSLVLVLALLLGMGFSFRFLRFKKQRKSVSGNQEESVEAVVDYSKEKDYSGDGCGSVRKYSWEEIKIVTMNFARVIGSGGFSNVYFANLPGSDQGAVKVHVGSDRLNQVFKQELDILLRLCHGNIVKLLGYCDDREEVTMVFEYVPNGNLQEKLHERESVLPWKCRTAIAFQLAGAIEYLHERCTLQIVHGDIKASNILLDENLNCKLCDFGSAKMGFSSTVLPPSSSPGSYRSKPVMVGSPGYTDPHYLRTGIASKKNDVYSLGVIILELVTGMPAFCPVEGQQLTSVLAPTLSNATELEVEEKLAELVDPRLGEEFNREEARTMFSVAAHCVHQSLTLRPSAGQILQILEQKIPSVSIPASLQK